MKIDVSLGECVDKVTILTIKLEKFQSAEKRNNVQKEYDLLLPMMEKSSVFRHSESFVRLLRVNQALWEIEDAIRLKESRSEFDSEFIRLARSVYKKNDERASIKREINQIYGSDLIEEKEYPDYSKS